MNAVRRVGVGFLLVGALAVAGCGDDDSDDGGGGTGAAATTPAETAAPATPATLAIAVTDDGKTASYTVPETVPAGVVEVTLENTGKGEHEAQIVRVDGQQTAAEVQKVVEGEDGKIPAWMHGAGGPSTTAPGTSRSATLVLKPGLHHIIDSEEGGAAAEPVSFTVEGTAPADAELPDAPATVIAKDFSFETSGLKAGRNTIRFENQGRELHHVLAFPLNEGATIEEFEEAARSEEEPEGPPPVDFERGVGTTVLDGGESQIDELELEKGRYALVCFITNRAGGPPHAALGMIDELAVE